MDGISTPDVSTASTETVSAPSEAPVSAPVQPEAQQATPEVAQAQPELQAAESVTAEPAELPDDETFERLPGPERGNNWKQARSRIAELNQQVQQFAAHQPVIEQIEQAGGWDRIQQQAELGALLFSQVEGENGQINLTAEPLIERLASESPETLGEIVWKGIHQPSPWNPDETIAHTFVREYLGLDPNLIETYRQIQSPADAQKYLQPGQVTAEELAAIPEQFHDAYKSLTQRQRVEFGLMDDAETKAEFLQDKADALMSRQYIAEQNQQRELAKQEQARQFSERVEQRGNEIKTQVRDAAIGSAKAKLQAEANFSTDPDVNEAIHNDAIQWAAQQCLADPSLAQDNDRADKLYSLAADAELKGDKIRANQYKTTADALTKKLEGRFLNMLTKRTALWSKALGASRTAQQQQVEQARPRAEIATSNQQTPRQNQQTQTVGHGFEPTPQRLEQYKQIYRASQMQNG